MNRDQITMVIALMEFMLDEYHCTQNTGDEFNEQKHKYYTEMIAVIKKDLIETAVNGDGK